MWSRFIFCLTLVFSLSAASITAHAQYVSPGCPGRWINYGGGMACQCPDGSLANGWPNITCGGGGGYQQPSGVRCSNGRYCPEGTYCSWMPGRCVPEGSVDCGGYSCRQGAKCGSGDRCIALEDDDCGDGSSCHAGTVCWRAPEDVEQTEGGKTTCQTPDERDRLARLVEQQKRDRQERKDREAAEAKFKADAPARQKVSDQLKKGLEQQRDTDLKKSTEQRQQELRAFTAEFGPRSANCRLVEMGWGAAEGKACALKELETAPPKNTAKLSSPRDPSWARARLEGLSRGESNSLETPTAPASGRGVTKQQLEYLRRNVATLQPESRRIALAPPPAVPQPAPQSLSTFMCGAPPNQTACPVTIEAQQKTQEVYEVLGVSPQAVVDRLEERHQKGLEYLRDSPEVKDALRSIQVKSAAFAAAGKVGMEVAENALAVQSIFESTAEFRQGKHYEGTLKAVNLLSSTVVDNRLKLPASDALNLAGAASTAYLYGFFKGL